jgi:MinD superfamily P-loop ATPase
MKVTIASGKGGTGKTTVAVSLVLSLTDEYLYFLDCDVEEPNAGLFLHPRIVETREVTQFIPQIDMSSCTACGRCAEVCQYHAIAVIGQQMLVFPELCHGCGSCTLNCPVNAIQEIPDSIGLLERGQVENLDFAQGTLNVGEAMAVPVIRQLKKWVIDDVQSKHPVILDAPPGASCPVVETMRGSDIVLLVTEPTPFGLHDLRLAITSARDELGIPVAVIINRDGVGDNGVINYCKSEGVPVLMHIPLERKIAVGLAQGMTLIEIIPDYRLRFRQLWAELQHVIRSTQQ